MKYLLAAALVVVVLYWLGRLRSRRPEGKASAPPPRQGEPMRQCADCGAYFPESEAVPGSSGAVYCSEQHRLRHDTR